MYQKISNDLTKYQNLYHIKITFKNYQFKNPKLKSLLKKIQLSLFTIIFNSHF